MKRLYDGGAGVPGYSGAAKKTAACAGMTLWYTSAFHGVVGVFVYRAVARHMDVDSASEHAVMIIRRTVGWGTAACKRRCDGGHDYAKGV